MPHLGRAKAKKILKDKSVRGNPLTPKQKGFFGAVAGGSSRLVKALKKKRKK